MKCFSLSAMFLFLFLSVWAQDGKVYPKTDIKKGVLKNGLTYYIYNNPVSKGKVNFYLIQDVGAILEEDSQDGLAHFLEHMAFNGTKNFPGKTISEKFEAKGLNYSINAYTGVDQTVYHFTNIPSNDRAFNDECMLMLYDWCNNLTLTPEAVEDERPVIIEEMRTRNVLNFRISELSSPVKHNNTKYAERNIIGPADVINNFKREELIDFYNTWYRTDLQAVVIIGDIDTYETETKLRNLFSTLPKVENPKERYHIIIPDNTETLFTEIREEELKETTVRIAFRHDFFETIDDNFTALLINGMLANRSRKLLKDDSESDKHFTSMSAAFSPLAYGYGNYSLNVTYKNGKAEQAMHAALGMHKHILQNGFTQEEFENIKNKMLKSLKRIKKVKGLMHNKAHFENIKKNFLSKTDIADADTNLKRFEKLIQKLSLEDIQNKLNEWYSGPNKSIIVQGNTDGELLTKQQVLDFETNCEPLEVIPDLEDEEEKEVNKEDLVSDELKGSSIVKTEKISDLYAEKWTLENGATVIYKECNANRNLISLYATSPGGFSALKNEELINAIAFNQFSKAFGIKGYTKKEFENLMKTSNINIIPKLTQKAEEFHSMSDYANIETLFQVLYNRFENPELYEDEFDEIHQKMSDQLRKRTVTHKNKLSDTIGLTRYGAEHYCPFDSTSFKTISAEKLKEVYRDRYQDAGNFDFYIVGGISKGKAKKLAQKYIGSIKSTQQNEEFQVLENKLEKGRLKRTFTYEIPGNQAGVIYNMDMNAENSYKNNLCYSFIKIHLQNELQDQIRQKARGTYGVHVKNRLEDYSSKNCNFEVRFECDPERAEELDEMLHETIMSVGQNGMNQTSFDIIKKMLDKPKRAPRKNNSYYMTMIKEFLETGINKDEEDFAKEQFDSIDLEYVNAALKELVEEAAILDIIYLPE